MRTAYERQVSVGLFVGAGAIAAAVAQGIITQQELDHLVYTDRLRREVVKVDDFEPDLGRSSKQPEGDPWQADSKKKAVVASM